MSWESTACLDQAVPFALPSLRPHSLLETHTSGFRLGRGGWFVDMFLWAPTIEFAIASGAKIHEDVVEIAHHVWIGAERRHDLLTRGVNILAAVDDDVRKV